MTGEGIWAGFPLLLASDYTIPEYFSQVLNRLCRDYTLIGPRGTKGAVIALIDFGLFSGLESGLL